MLYERLENLISQDADFDHISSVIESLDFRHGSFGVERKVIVSQLFKNIINQVIPNYAKYLLHASEESTDTLKKLSEQQKLVFRPKKLSKY